ncbi:MAG: type II toxin-antitoxin system PemK/MazF family toxin [Deltaproteobacteria bacterium]|nr:type II toxin-antitoxin system PemK/MazF family toxin [Deltaproteobacteria bacterium]
MKRGEVWWAELPKPAGRRPVVLLSRDEAYQVRELVTIAPLTTQIRNIPVEVRLGVPDGLPKECVVNADTITTIPKSFLRDRIALLRAEKLKALDGAIKFALALSS